MTAQAFLLNCFSLEYGNDMSDNPHRSQYYLDSILQRCGIQADWLDEISWILDKPIPDFDDFTHIGLASYCWQAQLGLDFTLLAAAVHKIACGNGHMMALAHQSGGDVHGCVLVSPAAAGRFNLLPVAELSTFYIERRKDTGTVTAGEHVMQLLEKSGMAAEEIHSVLLTGTSASDEASEQFKFLAEKDRLSACFKDKPVLQYLAEMTAGYSGSDSQIDIIANLAGKTINNLMVLKKL